MAGVDAPTLLAFAAGITGTVAAFGAKYLFDYRLAKRQLESDERAALATTLGGRPGQLRRAAARVHTRIASLERDAQHLDTWLRPAERPEQDGYYLRSSVQRVFMYVTHAALLQQAMDSLPYETMRARRDLQTQYVLLAAYQANEDCLMYIREWLSAMQRADARGSVVSARMFAVGSILRRYLSSHPASFADDPELRTRLGALSSLPATKGYDFAGRIPLWLDRQSSVARERWNP